jgi:hypothetical protein
MLNQNDDKPNHWIPYVIGMATTAIVSFLGTELVRWGVDELKHKYGSKPDAKPEEKKPDVKP